MPVNEIPIERIRSATILTTSEKCSMLTSTIVTVGDPFNKICKVLMISSKNKSDVSCKGRNLISE